MHPTFWLYWLAAFVVVVSVLAILAVAFEGERMTAESKMLRALWAVIVLVVVLAVGSVALATWAFAHDHARPEFDWWYETLMMPDNPSVRCCGKDDEYRCDAFVRNGETWCRVTDDRVVPNRPVVAVGTEILIPPHKYKFDQGNPTGHTLVFGRPSGGDFYVYCFVQGTLS
jgi:hypothetical protein